MIRLGFALLSTSSTAVTLRSAGFDTFGGPETKWACLAALFISFILFSWIYLAQVPAIHRLIVSFKHHGHPRTLAHA